MHEKIRRALALLLCLLLCPLFPPALGEGDEPAEAEAAGESIQGISPSGQPAPEDADHDIFEEEWLLISDEDWDSIMRFGQMTDIERDAEGNVTRVLGYPSRRVRAGFNSVGYKSSFQYETDFMDYPFWRPATVYDGNLAMMSLIMALCANRAAGFNDITQADYDPSFNVIDFLEDAGFGDIRKDDYSKVPTMYTVSTAIGTRRMEAEGQEPFTLIAVGVCGAGYKNEWISNLTPGSGTVHEGFQSAAQLVIDRLSGYIATRGIRGRIKIWISGFSRAAAVSNLTAGMLTRTGMFPKEDVFAYTFATPAAVINPPAEGFENIFNIMSPMDLIPQVMPSEWHYGRYGQDLFLPTPEFSGYFGSAAQLDRAAENRELYGVESRYSPGLNLRNRLLLSLLLDLIGSRDAYNEIFQPTVVGIMADKTLPNTLTTLRNLMLALQNVSHERRVNLDEFLDYVVRLFSAAYTRSGLGSTDQNTGSALLRLFAEHQENAYLSNSFTIRNELFEENRTAWYVLVKGPVTLRIRDADSGEVLLSMKSSGRLDTISEFLRRTENIESLYMERIGDVSVAALPANESLEAEWIAEGSGRVECRAFALNARASSLYDAWTFPVRTAAAEETGVICALSGGQLSPSEGAEHTSLGARAILEFLGIASLGINWRVALSVFYALMGLLLCILLCVIASRKPARRKKYSFFVWPLLCLFGVAVLEAETAYWFFADQAHVRLIWKGIGGLSLLVFSFLVRQPRQPILKSSLPPLCLGLAADLLISLHFVAGAILFLVFHLSLVFLFLQLHPMSRKAWIRWALVSLLIEAGIVFFYARRAESNGWIAVAYAPVMLLTAFSAWNQGGRFRLSALLFLIADLMMGLFFTFVNDPSVHVCYVLLFALANFLLVIGQSRGPLQSHTDAASENPSFIPSGRTENGAALST